MLETVVLAQAGNAPWSGAGEAFQGLIEELTSTQGRLAVSVAVLLLTLLLAVVVIPLLLRFVRAILDERVLTGPLGDAIRLVGEYVPRSFTELVLRTVQVALLIVAGLALLVVWGLIDVAIAVGEWIRAVTPDLINLAVTLLLLVLAVVGSDQLRSAIDRFSGGTDRITEHQEEIMLRVGQVTLFVTVGATVLTLWGVNLSGLLVGAGFLGIVVGFAARQTLGSMLAGFVLMFSRPFTIGDWVEIGEGQAEGVVTEITMFNTRIENFDGEFQVIPNDIVANETVTNRSQKGLLRIREDVGIDYGDDPEEARNVALEAMQDLEYVVDAPAPQAIPKGFGDSAILLELRFWIDHPTPPRKWRAVSAVVREVKAAFDEAGITIPLPQRTLSERTEGTTERVVTTEAVDGEGDVDGDGDLEGEGEGDSDGDVDPDTDD